MTIPASVARALLIALLTAACRSEAPAPAAPLVPQVDGTLEVDGLSAPVRVVRDRWGVPHITASNQDDLFIAQGFVQAQDRLFQMDLWRRAAQGRLAEVLGANFIQRDVMTRRMHYRGDSEAEWASYGSDTRAIATAFVHGINAWVAQARARLPEEFLLAGWPPEFWAPQDLLNRTEAFVASGNALDEVFRAQLAAVTGVATADQLLPPRATRPTTAPRDLDLALVSPLVADAIRRVGTAPFFLSLAVTLENPRRGALGAGSNAWAVAPTRSATAAALLAVDPHVWLSHPSLRYLVHLEAPGWRVAGATAPWRPGVAIGHNDRIAWGMTGAALDTQDVYVERLHPDDDRQTLAEGTWVESVFASESVVVRGRSDPVEAETQITPHGVVVAVDPERRLAFTVRWSGSEPGAAPELAALAIDRARTLPEFLAALERWKLPAAEFVYADVDGRIAWQAAGLVPIRPGWNGQLPVPGWSRQYEWRGWLRLEQLPRLVEPRSGRVVATSSSRARRERIEGVLAAASPLSRAAHVTLQQDTVAWNARQLVPLLKGVTADRADIETARARLVAWDARIDAVGEDATLYVRWERALLNRLMRLRLPPVLVDQAIARGQEILIPALVKPSSIWFDGNVAAGRDVLLLAALEDAVRSTGGRTEVTFAHPLAITDSLRERLNAGPFALAGYGETVLSVASEGDRVIGPAFRLIADPGDWDRSLVINAPGQSGSPASPHFRDLADGWVRGEYVPLAFSAEAVQANAVSTLTLTPVTRAP